MVSNVTKTSLTLSWNSSLNGVINSTFISYISVNSGQGNTISPLQGVSQATINLLAEGNTYNICVAVQSFGKNSSWSCTNVTTGIRTLFSIQLTNSNELFTA